MDTKISRHLNIWEIEDVECFKVDEKDEDKVCLLEVKKKNGIFLLGLFTLCLRRVN